MERPLQPGFETLWRIYLGLPEGEAKRQLETALHRRQLYACNWREVWLEVLSGALRETLSTYAQAQSLISAAERAWMFAFLNSAPIDAWWAGLHFPGDGWNAIGMADTLFETPERFRDQRPISLIDEQNRERDLQIPFLQVVLLEELAHCWDYRLRRQKSEYASEGARWRTRAVQQEYFSIPNRKVWDGESDMQAEDWASAVVWYVTRPTFWEAETRVGTTRRAKGLLQFAPERYQFCEALFGESN